jgi:hypothetical protein
VRFLAVLVVVGLAAALAPAAAAAPPANDHPQGAAPFEPVTAYRASPTELQGIAELAEAGPDRGVPRCLGPGSFARTVWFRVPAAAVPRELTVEASGHTLAVLDLAAFVQPADATAPAVAVPNQCSGVGAGGSDAAEEPTAAVTLRVPANRSVLVQVGRRGRVGSAHVERALLILAQRTLPAIAPPPGDSATGAPRARGNGRMRVALGGATLSDDDPAQPACPSAASVWRRITPTGKGMRTIAVGGRAAGTLTVFAGARPTATNALDCVNRARNGELQMRVPARKGQPLWVRIGTDTPGPNTSATLRVTGAEEAVVDGGPGGSDPTPGGPGGGLPPACDRSAADRARVSGSGFSGTARDRNRRPVLVLPVRITRGFVCNVEARLIGPGGRIYATGRAIRLKTGARSLRLVRERRYVRGNYVLRVTALDPLDRRRVVRGTVRGSLR